MPFNPPPPQEVAYLTELLLCQTLEEGKPAEALKHCERAYRLKPSPNLLDTIITLAYRLGNEKLLEKLLKGFPAGASNNPQPYEIKAFLSLLRGDEKGFYENAKGALERGSKNLELILRLNEKAFTKGDFKTVRQTLEALYKMFPNNERVFNLLYTFSDQGERIELLKERIKKYPRKEYFLKLAELLTKEGKGEEALRYLKKGAQLFTELGEAYIRALLAAGRYDEAFKYARSAGEEDLFFESALDIASRYGRADLFRYLEEKLSEKPDNRYLSRLLTYTVLFDFAPRDVERVGNLLVKSKAAPREALRLYAAWRLLNGRPPLNLPADHSPEGVLLEVLKNLKGGNLAEASRLLREVPRENLKGFWKNLADALEVYIYYRRGYPAEKLFKIFGTERVLRAADTLYRFDKSFARNVLRAYTSLNRDEEAFRKAFAVAYGNGDFEFLTTLLEPAVRLYPDSAEFLNAYAYTLLMAKGANAAAVACPLLERAARLEPNNKAILDSLGWCYYLKGEIEKAYPLLKAAVREGEPVIEYHFAEVLRALGKTCEALRYARRALEDLKKYPKPPEPGLEERVRRLMEELRKECKGYPKRSS